MRTVRFLIGFPALAFAIFGSIALWADAALGCSCAQRELTAQQVLDDATAVFTGVATVTTPIGPQHALTKFTVVESFKGAPEGTEVIVRHRSGPTPSCGVSFTPNMEHMVVAQAADESPGLVTSYCSLWMFKGAGPSGAKLIEDIRAIRNP